MMVGAGDHRMLEHLDSSVLSETVKKAFFNILLELVPYTFSIGLEGTIGITIDNKQMLFLHFSDTVDKASEDDDAVVAAVVSLPQHAKRNSVCSRCSLSCERNKISVPGAHDKTQPICTNGGGKHSLRLGNVHPIQNAFSPEDVLVQTTKTEYLDECSDLPLEKSTAARRKGRPAKFSSDGVTVFRDVRSSRVSNVCPVTGEEEVDVSPPTTVGSYASGQSGGLDVLDFSRHKKVEFLKTDAPDCSVAANENPKCSGFQMGSVDDDLKGAPGKPGSRNQLDQTLLRQLLLHNTKTKKVRSGKRRLSGSDDESNKKPCAAEISSSIAENLKTRSSSQLPQESDACVAGAAFSTTPGYRSNALKRTEVKGADDSGGERRANPDSILCRLLTSGVNMYDTTEVERLRQASSNKQKIAVDLNYSQNMATSGQLGDTVFDLVSTNVKTEREPYLRTDEFFRKIPVDPTEYDTLCFQSTVQHPASNSLPEEFSHRGFGLLRGLADAAIIVQPQLQADCDVAQRCLAVVKEERNDSVDVHRTLYVPASSLYSGDAQTMENLYQTHSTRSSDFRN